MQPALLRTRGEPALSARPPATRRPMSKPAALGLLVLLGTGFAPAADRHGDPLPAGAVARLGTARFRPGLTGGRGVRAAVSPDSKVLATGEPAAVRFWDLATGTLIRRVALPSGNGGILELVFSPDGKRLAV